MTIPDEAQGLAIERTALAQRRTMLSLLANAMLLARLGAVVGVLSAALVLVLAAWVYSSPKHLLPPSVWCSIVAVVGLVDALTIVVWAR